MKISLAVFTGCSIMTIEEIEGGKGNEN